MKCKILLCCAAMCATPSVHAEGLQWTLDECLAYAIQHNITLRKSSLQQQQAAEELRGAKGALLPTLNAGTNHSLGYRPWQATSQYSVSNGYVNSKVDKGYYSGSYQVNVNWTVWNGGRNTNTVKLDRLAEEQAEMSVRQTANSIQERIAQLYVQVSYLTENVKVLEQSLQTSTKNVERGQQMVSVGKMSRADLSQLEAQQATDRYNLVEMQAQVSNYTLQLKQLLELTTEEFGVAVPTVSQTQVMAAIPALQGVYQAALDQRPEIAGAENAVKSAELNVKIARAGYMPNVSINAGAGTSTSSLSDNSWGLQMKNNFDLMGGISLQVPIFDAFQTRTAIRKAKLQQQQAQLDLQDKQKQLYATIEGFWLDATTNQAKYRAATVTVESEQQSYALLEQQFQLGLKNIIELLQGKDKLLAAQQNQLQSKYQTILSLQLLRFYESGQI